MAGVSLRPNDPLAKKLSSVGIETRNLLVRVTLPKRTGRKRKRGSDDPYQDAPHVERTRESITAPDLLRRLRDTEGTYQVQAVGVLRETHRFRTLPDFQLRNDDLPIMRKVRENILKPDYKKFQDFRIDLTAGNHGITAYPGPPVFTSFDMPHKYEYQQASGVVYVEDAQGVVIAKNISAPPKRLTWNLPPDVDQIPTEPPMAIPQIGPAGEMLPRAIEMLQKLMEERPLVTKRVALNCLPPVSDTIFREASQYVGYSFKAGPWRDSLIRYGVDPRKDPKFRFYQTMMFQVDRDAFKSMPPEDNLPRLKTNETMGSWARPLRHTRDDPTTHIFDGKSISANGKTWQVCDVTDPLVHAIFHTDDIRTECDVFQWGWYHNGTIGKARAIMKDKIRHLFAKKEQPTKDYEAIAALPNVMTVEMAHEAVLSSKQYGSHACALATDVRSCVKGGDGNRSAKALWLEKRKAIGGSAELNEEWEGEMGGLEEGVDDEGSEAEPDGGGDFADMETVVQNAEEGEEEMDRESEADGSQDMED